MKERKFTEWSIKAQIEDLNVNFYFFNNSVHLLDVELKNAVLKLRKENAVLSIEAKCIEELSWLRNVLEESIKAEIDSLELSCYYF